jgi:hypothetical protein
MTHPHTNHNRKRNKIATQNSKLEKTRTHIHTDLEHTRDNKTTQRFGNRFPSSGHHRQNPTEVNLICYIKYVVLLKIFSTI